MKINKHITKRFKVKKISQEWFVLDKLTGDKISFDKNKAEAEHTAKGLNVTDQTLFESNKQRIYIGDIK